MKPIRFVENDRTQLPAEYAADYDTLYTISELYTIIRIYHRSNPGNWNRKIRTETTDKHLYSKS